MDKAWFGPGKKGLPPRRQEAPVAKVDLHELVADQFVCFKCSRPAPVHVWLNGQLWNEIRPDYTGRAESGGVLCLYCMSDVLAKMGYKDGTVGLTISNGPFCNMKWQSVTKPYEDEIASLRARVEAMREADWLNMMPREIVARAALAEGCREETAEAIRSGLHTDVKIRAEVAVKLIGMIQEECFAALKDTPG